MLLLQDDFFSMIYDLMYDDDAPTRLYPTRWSRIYHNTPSSRIASIHCIFSAHSKQLIHDSISYGNLLRKLGSSDLYHT